MHYSWAGKFLHASSSLETESTSSSKDFREYFDKMTLCPTSARQVLRSGSSRSRLHPFAIASSVSPHQMLSP